MGDEREIHYDHELAQNEPGEPGGPGGPPPDVAEVPPPLPLPDEPPPRDTRTSVERLSRDEIERVAWGIAAGQVFTDRHFRSPEECQGMLGSVFLPIGLGAMRDTTPEYRADLGMVYEWLDRAGPLSVNGHPMFFGMRVASRADAATILARAQEIREAKDAALQPPKVGDAVRVKGRGLAFVRGVHDSPYLASGRGVEVEYPDGSRDVADLHDCTVAR